VVGQPAERIDVGAVIDAPARQELLGGAVGGAGQQIAGDSAGGARAPQPGAGEVCHLDPLAPPYAQIGDQEEVLAAEPAVNDAVVVRGAQGARRLDGEVEGVDQG
jgi:hypothetical protein